MLHHGIMPAGEGPVAIIDARDIAEVAAVCLTEPGHEGNGFHLTGPHAVTFDQVADLLSVKLGRTIRYEPATVIGYSRHHRKQGLVLPHAVVQTVLHTGLRRGDAGPVTQTVEDLLGGPARSPDDYVSDNLTLWDRPQPVWSLGVNATLLVRAVVSH